MSVLRCLTCNQQFDSEKSPAMPFCSVRCQQIDLGRWLDERFGVPYEGDDEEEPDEGNGQA